ncbi:hypothetical protein CRYUN_Cryun10bG0065400 [Craigia yunnanensis]
MSEGLEDMWNKLSLIEEEQYDVVVEKEWVEDILEVGKNYLIRKLILKKAVNVEAMKYIFFKIWKISTTCSFEKWEKEFSSFNLKTQWRKSECFRDNLDHLINLFSF